MRFRICSILHLTDNHDEFPRRRSRLLKEALAARYYREVDEEGQSPPPEGIIEYIKPKQLLNLYNLIHGHVESRSRASSTVPLTDEEVEVKIGQKEAMFGTMLDNAIKEMWEMDEHNGEESLEELYSVRGGWQCGKSYIYGIYFRGFIADSLHLARDGRWKYPSWVYGPADVHDPVNMEPDSTSTEFEVAGNPLPNNVFSRPYEGQQPAQGNCIICMNELGDLSHGLVVARCTTGHIFHSHCLNHWVNDSAMENANLCPHDRDLLCDPRPRVHQGELLDDSSVVDSTDIESLHMDTDVSDEEGSDADAEGSDDDDFDMNPDDSDEEALDVDTGNLNGAAFNMELHENDDCDLA